MDNMGDKIIEKEVEWPDYNNNFERYIITLSDIENHDLLLRNRF